MTVGELIEKLSKMDPKLPVMMVRNKTSFFEECRTAYAAYDGCVPPKAFLGTWVPFDERPENQS